jgi:hypothetical protein
MDGSVLASSTRMSRAAPVVWFSTASTQRARSSGALWIGTDDRNAGMPPDGSAVEDAAVGQDASRQALDLGRARQDDGAVGRPQRGRPASRHPRVEPG